MPHEIIDWREIFNGQIREIQARYPLAHEALRNWGLWSRETGGIFPSLAKPGWTEFYKPDGDGYGEAEAIPDPTETVKAERVEAPRSDERSGMEVDIRIHALHFPTIWRRVLRAAYVTVEIPEYECPRAARVGYQGYVTFLDAALEHLQGALE